MPDDNTSEGKKWFEAAAKAGEGIVAEEAQRSNRRAAGKTADTDPDALVAGGYQGVGSAHSVTIPQRPAQPPAPARMIPELAAALPPGRVRSVMQGQASAAGWDVDHEVVLGHEELQGFVLREGPNPASRSDDAGSSDGTGASQSTAKSLTLYSSTCQQLMTMTFSSQTGTVTLPDGAVIASLARSTSHPRVTLTGAGPLEGLEWLREPSAHSSGEKLIPGYDTDKNAPGSVSPFDPWVDKAGDVKVAANVVSPGAMPVADIEMDETLEGTELVFAWAAALDYWFTVDH